MKRNRLFVITLIIAAFLFCMRAALADDEPQYIENEWNFVETSMDVSDGIPENASGVLERIRKSRRLRVATEPYFPPQEFIDPSKVGQNRFAGSDINLANLIADRMGVTLEIIPLDFSDVLPAVEDGTCDLAISALAYTPARAVQYELSKGYYFSEENAGNGIMIRSEDLEKFHEIKDFSNSVIAAQSGSLQEFLMAENFSSYSEFIRVNSIRDVYAVLESGKADGVMVDIETAQTYIENEPDCGLTLLPGLQFYVDNEHYMGDRIAAKKGQKELIAFVNGVIDEVVDSGSYMKWYREADEQAKKLGL